MMRAAPNPGLEEKEQYHHYIPRFILRAFAAQPQPNYDDPTPPVRRRGKKKKKTAKTAAGDAEYSKGYISLGLHIIKETTNHDSVENDSPDEANPSNAFQGPESTAQHQPTCDKPTRPVRKKKKKLKPAKTAARDAKDSKG